MPNLNMIYESLILAATRGCFESELMKTPLAEAKIKLHPLGFKIFSISNENCSLRLHVWGREPEGQLQYKIHDHSFDFRSHVVEGVIRHTKYLSRVDNVGNYRIYNVSYDDTHSYLHKTLVSVSIQQVSQEFINESQSYNVMAEELHSSELWECDSAISIVLARERLGRPIVIGPKDGPAEMAAVRNVYGNLSLVQIGLGNVKLM